MAKQYRMQNHFVSGLSYRDVERERIAPPINYLYFLLHLKNETTVDERSIANSILQISHCHSSTGYLVCVCVSDQALSLVQGDYYRRTKTKQNPSK